MRTIIYIAIIIIFQHNYTFSQVFSDSLFVSLAKNAPAENQKYWSAYRPYLEDNVLKKIGDSVVGTGDISRDNQIIELRIKEKRKNGTNTQYTFYYLTPATYPDATLNINLWTDNYTTKVLSSNPEKVKRIVFGRFSLLYYTINAEGIETPWKDFTYSSNYLGYMIVAKNKVADKKRTDQVYEKQPEKQPVTNTYASTNKKEKITCPDCSGKGSYSEKITSKCTPCWGTGKIKCGSCGGGGRIYTISRDRSEYCPNCHGSGTKTCNSCNGYGEKQVQKNTKCKTCNGTKFIFK